MKPIREQNFYEIFELSPDASRESIEAAYDLAKKTYGEKALATYSLFDTQERREILERIHRAYETLSDESRRRQYDREVIGLGDAGEPTPLAPPADGQRQEAPAAGDRLHESSLPDIETITGSRLREYREKRNIPLQEIARQTRINITYFEFLERENYRGLPPPVYLRSYLIQYAKMLGLDPTRLVSRILALVEQAGRKDS